MLVGDHQLGGRPVWRRSGDVWTCDGPHSPRSPSGYDRLPVADLARVEAAIGCSDSR